MDPFQATLPQECKSAIFSFLSLKQVLTFGSSSKTCLRDILSDLNRRKQLLTCDYAGLVPIHCHAPIRQKGKLEVWSDKHELKYHAQEQQQELQDDNETIRTHRIVRLSSVLEQVTQLSQRLPKEYPLKYKLDEMVGLLKNRDSHGCKNAESAVIETPDLSFGNLLQILQQEMRAHKLHAHVLSQAISSRPTTMNPSLDHYMGDVLCVTFLLNYSSLRIIEGGPRTFHHKRLDNRDDMPAFQKCYQSWVYLHSSLLRTKRFPPAVQSRLGIPNFHTADLARLVPSERMVFDSTLSSSQMMLVFHAFGSVIGAAFRGRDSVRSSSMTGEGLLALLLARGTEDQETIQRAQEWLLLLHEQSRMSRPMTMTPPYLRLSLLES